MQKLALVGYGKMGKLIEQLAPDHGFEVAVRLGSADNPDGQGITPATFAGIDVAIEFSAPSAAVANLDALAHANVPAVTGTTGWLDHLPQITKAFSQADAALVWSPNFSIGVSVFRRLVETASELLAGESQYGAWAREIHHAAKKDAPSGTLLHLVEAMRRHGYNRPIDVASNRAGHHPGTHEIGFDSAADTITLQHVARSREGFARGALKAAQWVHGRRGVYTFDEVLFGSPQPSAIRNTVV